jgi:hypothetical protein
MSNFDFINLLSPKLSDDFFLNFWENQLLHVKIENNFFYKKLFSIDNVLEYGKPRGGSLRVVKNQEPFLASKYENQDGSLNLNQLYSAYADGYTIVVNDQTDQSAVFINIPAVPTMENMELTEEQLEAIAGGGYPWTWIKDKLRDYLVDF